MSPDLQEDPQQPDNPPRSDRPGVLTLITGLSVLALDAAAEAWGWRVPNSVYLLALCAPPALLMWLGFSFGILAKTLKRNQEPRDGMALDIADTLERTIRGLEETRRAQ